MRITILFSILVLIFSCKEDLKTVLFETPVDTTDKPIELQIKKTYTIDDLGVYASNEFDAARLNGFEKLNDSTATVIINPENFPINKSPYYAFETWSDSVRPFYFKFKYPKGQKHRYTAKIKTNNTWRIIDSTDVFKEDDTIVTIKLNVTPKPQIVAAHEIQSSKIVKDWYTDLIKDKDYLDYKIYGKSKLGRDLPVMNISIGDTKKKDIVVLMTRQHPPEVTGFYAFQYFIETILNESKLSHDFLKKYHVIVFPILNPDGVDLGHWRHNAGGVDTNRDWSVYNQPEVRQTVDYITNTVKENKARILLGLDFHSTYEDVFYTNRKREGTTLPSFIDDWFAALEANIPNYKVNEAAGNSTKPVSKGWFLYGHNAVGITYEIGDATPKDRIQLIGKVTAEEMMKILTKTNIN